MVCPRICQRWMYHHLGAIFLPLKLHQILVIIGESGESYRQDLRVAVHDQKKEVFFEKYVGRPYGSIMFIIYKRLFYLQTLQFLGGGVLFLRSPTFLQFASPYIFIIPTSSETPSPATTTPKKRPRPMCQNLPKVNRNPKASVSVTGQRAKGFFSPQMVGEGSLANEMFRFRNC